VNATSLGLVAGALTTGAWLPQLLRTWRLRRAEEISWGYLGVLGAGIACWLVYGVLVSSIAVILANAATLALLGALAGMKGRTRESDRELASE
jgi:MtN3 and saliva related transmembrane protein